MSIVEGLVALLTNFHILKNNHKQQKSNFCKCISLVFFYALIRIQTGAYFIDMTDKFNKNSKRRSHKTELGYVKMINFQCPNIIIQ